MLCQSASFAFRTTGHVWLAWKPRCPKRLADNNVRGMSPVGCSVQVACTGHCLQLVRPQVLAVGPRYYTRLPGTSVKFSRVLCVVRRAGGFRDAWGVPKKRLRYSWLYVDWVLPGFVGVKTGDTCWYSMLIQWMCMCISGVCFVCTQGSIQQCTISVLFFVTEWYQGSYLWNYVVCLPWMEAVLMWQRHGNTDR